MLKSLHVTLIGSALGGSLAQLLLASAAFANPLGAAVTTGAASIASASNKTQIDQKSEDVVIDWSSFNIGAGQTTQFLQPNAQAIAVNRIGGNSASQIFGTLDANGRIVLINGNGMLFGKGSQVNVGALIATSTGGADSDVLAGNFTQAGNRNASVVNQGSIRTSQGGLVALVAPSVTNAGTVTAKFGTIAVGAANKFTVDFTGDGLVSFAAQGDVTGKASAINTGSLTGANVSLTAHAAEGLATGVVAMSGIVVAQTAQNIGGTITLDAGDGGNVSVSRANLAASGANGGGTIRIGGWNQNAVAVDKASILNASAGQTGNGGSISVISGNTHFQGSALAQGGASGGNGGTIETSGHNLNFAGASINAGAAHGRDGSWLLDPYDLTVGGKAAQAIDTSLDNGTNVTLQTTASGASGPGNKNASGNGDIFIDSAIDWTSTATLTLSAYRNIDFNASVVASGGGSVAMTTGTGTTGDYSFDLGPHGFAGSLQFTGGSSSGSTLTINGTPYTLLYSMSDVQNINSSSTTLKGDYALAMPFDASGISNWVPIGGGGANAYNGFVGTFTGLGNTISNLTVNTGTYNYAGLFGFSSGTIRDVGLIGGAVSGNANVGELVGDAYYDDNIGFPTIMDSYATGTVSGNGNVGGLVGEVYGEVTITGSYSTGAVMGTGSDSYNVGGLVGISLGNIESSYATGAVSGGIGSTEVGGLVGYNDSGALGSDYARGAVSGGSSVGGLVGELYQSTGSNIANVYATGAVAGTEDVGGLVGRDYESYIAISDAHATGSVSGGADSKYIGGLIGESEDTGTISYAYATGKVAGGSGSTDVGGLIGSSDHSLVSYSYATGNVSGAKNVGGLIGIVGHRNQYVLTDLYSTGQVTGKSDSVGGLVGTSFGKITNSYSTSAVVGKNTEYVGGLVGYNGGVIDYSYSIGAVTGNGSDVGGLVGFDDASASVNGSYWDTQTSGQSTSDGGKARTTAQLQDKLPNGFDPAIWGEDISIDDGLPYLLALPPS